MIARSLRRRRSGQGMTEYIILVGLIAILLITVVSRYGEVIKVTIIGTAEKTDDIADRMGGGGNGLATDPGSSSGSGARRTFPGVTGNTVVYDGHEWNRVGATDEFERGRRVQ